MVVASIVEDGAIIGVIVESKSGVRVLGQVVIDATGDADIAIESAPRPGRRRSGDAGRVGHVPHVGVDKAAFIKA